MLFYGGWFDVGYGLVLIGLVVSLWASWNVKSTFRRYQNDHNSRGLTAAQVARQILDDNGLYQIRIERVSGNLTDHYDPKGNVIRLSDSVHDSTSVAAIGVAAHECGHAVQHSVDYFPMQVRSAIIPVDWFPAVVYRLSAGHDLQQFLRRNASADGWHPAVFPYRILPAGDPAGGIQRQQPCHADAGKPVYFVW